MIRCVAVVEAWGVKCVWFSELGAEMCTVWLLKLGQNVFIFCCWNLGLECMVLPLVSGAEMCSVTTGTWDRNRQLFFCFFRGGWAEIALSPLEF